MKILLSAIPLDNGKSGISVYIREVVKALESAGHELTLIVEDDGAKEFERFDLIRIKKRRALFSMLYSLFILPWRIKWKRYDFCIMLAANRRVFSRYPIPTIAVVHDLSQYHVPVKYDRFRMFYIKKVLPHYVRKAQYICAISQSTKNELIQYWNIPEEYKFEEKVQYIVTQINEYVIFKNWNQEKTIFQKTSRALFGLDCVLQTLEYSEFDKELLNDFILNLVGYFIEIECDDFNDLKD